jgi:hypothetical protein
MKKIIILATVLMSGIAHAQSNSPSLPSFLKSVPGILGNAAKPTLPTNPMTSDPCQHSNTYSLDPNNPNANGCSPTQATPPATPHKVTI